MSSNMEPSSLFSVKGLVAVITGGGSGIGLMMARTLASNGAARVYILGRHKETLDAAVLSINTGTVVPIVADVTCKESLLAAAIQIHNEAGFINVLFANAGTRGPRIQTPPQNCSIEEFQSQLWEIGFQDHVEALATNIAGVWFTVVAFLGLLDGGNKKRNVMQSSQVITTGSVAGWNRATPGNYAYAQSKAAANHLMKQLATGLVPYGIRSNMIAPGLYPSDAASSMIARFSNVSLKSIIPVGRIGNEEDMAGCVLYLTSRAGAYMSGAVILTDGGSLSLLPASY